MRTITACNNELRRLAKTPIQQPGLAVILEPLPPKPKRPLIDPKQLSRFHLVQFRRLVAAQYARELDHKTPLKDFRPALNQPFGIHTSFGGQGLA